MKGGFFLGNTTTLLIYFGILAAITYFIIIRPQQKQRKDRETLLNNLRVRDRVLTAGGIYGKIMKIKDVSVILQVAEKVEIEVAKSGIISVENRDITAENEKE
jgi:preprotein translocase subunit YajC